MLFSSNLFYQILASNEAKRQKPPRSATHDLIQVFLYIIAYEYSIAPLQII